VHGHSDDKIPHELLTLPQQLNTRCDKLAKQHLQAAILNDTYTPAAFPNEEWGKKKAKALFEKRDKVPPWAFDEIHWEDMHKVMNRFPKTFQDWTTRHISDFTDATAIYHVTKKDSKISAQAADKPMRTLNTSQDALTPPVLNYSKKMWPAFANG
jgi:hypothetical protein